MEQNGFNMEFRQEIPQYYYLEGHFDNFIIYLKEIFLLE